jgi:hypothetical protein
MARATALRLALILAFGVPACAAAPRVDVDGERALRRVVRQVEAGPRVPGAAGHAAVRDWIAAELTRLGARVERQTFVDSSLGRPIELTNLIGRFAAPPGRRDADLPRGRRDTNLERGAAARTIALCAHYDTRPFSDRDPDPALRDRPCPGANDGGSGVAVLLEIAELLARRPAPVAVELVFFDGEDQGQAERPEQFALGSRGYARRLGEAKPTAAFLFDMVGDRDLNIHAEGISSSRAANLVAMVNEGARATGARSFHRDVRHTVTDDHVPLLDAGVPAVDIIDFDYGAWHTTADLPDRVSAASLAEVARVAAWLVYESPLARRR